MTLPESEQLGVYRRIRRRARQIVSRFPLPSFYSVFHKEVEFSQAFFGFDPVIHQLYRFAAETLEDDFGHGLDHAVKVAIDAGALVAVEGSYHPDTLNNRVRVVQAAGLLHDIRRKQKNHAAEGAQYAGKVLRLFPFSIQEQEDIVMAIRNHEAFRKPLEINTLEGQLVSDCLYDADKFRWGPDNFSDTLWDMLIYLNPPYQDFITRYPQGMKVLANIRETFRTETGKRFGPEFIDMGIDIGNELFWILMDELRISRSAEHSAT